MVGADRRDLISTHPIDQALRGEGENMKALEELIAACEQEFVGDVCTNEPDDEPVMMGRNRWEAYFWAAMFAVSVVAHLFR